MVRTLAVICLLALPTVAAATDVHTGHSSPDPVTAPYAGQEARSVTSLSESDIEALRAGEGWGLAKPAELRGYPGPRHVLDLADQLDLSDDQRRRIEAIFNRMNAQARMRGETLIAAEQALDALFEEGQAEPERLESSLAAAEEARAALRYVHLAAHLEVVPLLTRHQRHTYSVLRGYADGGGHDSH